MTRYGTTSTVRLVWKDWHGTTCTKLVARNVEYITSEHPLGTSADLAAQIADKSTFIDRLAFSIESEAHIDITVVDISGTFVLISY